jgi:hypothetical protein
MVDTYLLELNLRCFKPLLNGFSLHIDSTVGMPMHGIERLSIAGGRAS